MLALKATNFTDAPHGPQSFSYRRYFPAVPENLVLDTFFPPEFPLPMDVSWCYPDFLVDLDALLIEGGFTAKELEIPTVGICAQSRYIQLQRSSIAIRHGNNANGWTTGQ